MSTAADDGPSCTVPHARPNGTFMRRVDVLAGPEPYSIAVGDLNGDGQADLAVANRSGNAVSVLLGVGNGNFGTRVQYGAAFRTPGIISLLPASSTYNPRMSAPVRMEFFRFP